MSDILIKGMEMPKSYKDIRIYADGRVVSRSLHTYGEKIAIATPATTAQHVEQRTTAIRVMCKTLTARCVDNIFWERRVSDDLYLWEMR